MASTVREVMDSDPATVAADTSIEDVVRTLRKHELPGHWSPSR